MDRISLFIDIYNRKCSTIYIEWLTFTFNVICTASGLFNFRLGNFQFSLFCRKSKQTLMWGNVSQDTCLQWWSLRHQSIRYGASSKFIRFDLMVSIKDLYIIKVHLSVYWTVNRSDQHGFVAWSWNLSFSWVNYFTQHAWFIMMLYSKTIYFPLNFGRRNVYI